MKNLFKKLFEMKGQQYFFLSSSVVMAFFALIFTVDFIDKYVKLSTSLLIESIFLSILMIAYIGLGLFFFFLAGFGVILLFRVPTLKGRIWVWCAVTVNILLAYGMIWGTRLTY